MPTPRRQFLKALDGVTDPETKRKTIGALFIDVFEAEAKKIGGAQFLAQGTLYPDVIESVSFTGGPSVTIKSHHNVGGLPARMNMKLVEPLRELFKDEVRELGRELGLPPDLVNRHPFPGPGLAIRIPGNITKEKLDLLRQVDAVYLDEIRKAGPLRRDLAGLRGAAAGAHRRRDGRRADVRPGVCAAGRHLDRRHDGGLLPVRARVPGAGRQPHHQRGAGDQPGDVRHHVQAAGDDRVGVTGAPQLGFVLGNATGSSGLAEAFATAASRSGPDGQLARG